MLHCEPLPSGSQSRLACSPCSWPSCSLQIHVVTPSGADQLSAYLKHAGWEGGVRRGGAAVHVMAAPGCRTEGEALRFVEQKDVIKGDFVLVSGCVVANADLKPAVQVWLQCYRL